jgi:hypothetical protein
MSPMEKSVYLGYHQEKICSTHTHKKKNMEDPCYVFSFVSCYIYCMTSPIPIHSYVAWIKFPYFESNIFHWMWLKFAYGSYIGIWWINQWEILIKFFFFFKLQRIYWEHYSMPNEYIRNRKNYISTLMEVQRLKDT